MASHCLAISDLSASLVTTIAMGSACAVLSVIVVLRRWAFIGEGIAHAGFGGAGTAWLLALLFPATALLSHRPAVYGIAMLFCVGVGLLIAFATRRGQLGADTAIGICLVGSIAWGFIASGIYRQVTHALPPTWDEFLFGQLQFPVRLMFATALICLAIVAVVAALWKEIIAYGFDPALAEMSGVRVGFIHYLLIVMVTLTILVGMMLMGPLLVTAFLVLPGAIALQLSRKLAFVVALAVLSGVVGAVAGPLISTHWHAIPGGPAMVLVLIGEFGAAYGWGRISRQGAAR